MASTQQGAVFQAEEHLQQNVLGFLKQALSKDCFDAVLLPVKLPVGDSFAFLLVQNESLLKDAYPLSPIMPVQGAKAISSLTRRGKGKKKIAAILRPCEARATVELFKLGQVDLENIVLISIDCPGALPLADWLNDPKQAEDAFKELLQRWDSEGVRPVCKICANFSVTGAEDLHIGTLGTENGSILLIPRSSKGRSILDNMGLSVESDISKWKDKVDKLTGERREKRRQAQQELGAEAVGLDNLLHTFSTCINCHNCMRVCPICYCRQCFFDSHKLKFPFEDYLMRAEMIGGLRLPPETLLFHMGRMLHMSLSCVSCGACEDACPMSLPVAQMFSLVASSNQEAFGYVPGRSREESLPLRVYEEEEFQEMEQSYIESSAKQGARDA